ncbi:MAG: MATE family efflux transporter [Aristaeellaceae bacterium]
MKDLTVGRPGRVLVSYTLPLFGSIIFQQLYNIADSLVAGRYIGTQALAAVGNSYEITLIYIALAFGCNIGCSVITARCFGEKRWDEVRCAITTSLIFSAVLGLVLTLSGFLLGSWMLRLIRTPQEVFDASAAYLNIYLMGYVFLILYQVATGIFSAMGDSRTPFWFLAVSSVSNIFVDILFVKQFGMGVEGVAWATFLCQSISGTVAVMAVLLKLRRMEGRGAAWFSFPVLRKILTIAAPSALQQSFVSVGNILIQSVINGFGTAAIGGYAAAIKLNNMTITSITALGNGMSNYTSQNLGAGKHERIRQGFRSGAVLGGSVALLFAIAYFAFASQLVGVFITDGNAAAHSIGVQFLRIVAPFYVVVAMKLISDGVLRGSSQMKAFMVSTMTDLFLRVTLAFLLSAFLGDIVGVWLSWPVGWMLGTILSCVFYARWSRSILQAASSRL